MVEIILLYPLILSFFIALIFLPPWINKAKKIGLIWQDMNKYNFPKNVAGSGGLIVLFAFITGVLSYIAIRTFILQTEIVALDLFVLITTVLIAGLIGLTDDFLGWVRGGLSAKMRMLLMLMASIPLIVINAGESIISIPFVGPIEMGLFYPLLFIPIGIVGAGTTFNFLAGYNGLEASQSILLLSALSAVTWFVGEKWLSLVALCMLFAIFAFYLFNKYPAKIFPGNIMTYSVGVLIACIAILGDIERIAVFFFIPYILETMLKLRGNLKKHSFAKVNEDNSLEIPFERFYGLEHVAIAFIKKIKPSKKVYEKEVTLVINIFQVIIIILGFIIFNKGIFLS